jgi:glycosyltransferase involved in cell wall biosynthesis
VAGGYPVNRYLIQGLKAAGAEVVECREELWEGFLHRAFQELGGCSLLRLGFRVLNRYLRLIRRYRRVGPHGCAVVGYPGYADIALARLLNLCRRRARRRTLVLVAFISLYDTVVVDRGQVAPGSWKAKALRAMDRFAFTCADLVLVDTEQQGAYYAEICGLPPRKFQRSFVGHEFAEGEPAAESYRAGEKGFRVLFFGTYVPLHGIEAILEAAARLRAEADIGFTLIGAGQLYGEMRERAGQQGLDNIRFIDTWMGPAELKAQVVAADVCLGIFGETAKAARVIPYKVFGALALRKPVVTRDSPAIRELLVDGKSALLCPAGDGRLLAAAIARLRNDPELAGRIAARGHAVYLECGSPAAVGRELLQRLEGWHG